MTVDVAGRCLDEHIEGAVNLRDLGGFPAREGRIRHGRVFRSGMTHHITKRGLEALAGTYGVRRVFDLRAPEEIEKSGRAPFEDAGIAWHHLPVLGTFTLRPEERKDALRRFAEGEASWGTHYVELIERWPHSYRDLFSEMGSSEGLPAIFHCSAGRDRTGIAAALLLGLLGVSDDDIAADYASTGTHLRPHAKRFMSPDSDLGQRSEEQIQKVLQPRAEHVHDFLVVLKERHGSSEGFLRDAGVEQRALDQIRADLAGPA